MRLVAFFLILANVLYGVYWYLNPTQKSGEVQSATSAAAVMPGRPLVLASELGDSEVTERVINHGVQDPSAVCLAYGPLGSSDSVALLSRIKGYTNQAFSMSEMVSVGNDYQVLVGPYPTQDEALIGLPSIREFVQDSFILEDASEFFISVGIFKIKENAEAKLSEVKARGATSVGLKQVARNHDEYWVLWPETAIDEAAETLAVDFNELKLNGKLLKRPCEGVVQTN